MAKGGAHANTNALAGMFKRATAQARVQLVQRFKLGAAASPQPPPRIVANEREADEAQRPEFFPDTAPAALDPGKAEVAYAALSKRGFGRVLGYREVREAFAYVKRIRGLRSFCPSAVRSPAPSNAFRHLYFASRLMWNCSSKPLARMTVSFFRSPRRCRRTRPIWDAFPGKADAFINHAIGMGPLRKLPVNRGFLGFLGDLGQVPM